MQIHTLSPHSSQKTRKRIGRGGKRGTYSGKGQKGQKARSGAKISPLFTGGSASLSGQGSRVIHKRRGQSPVQGHHRVTNIKSKKNYSVVSIDSILAIFEDGATINREALLEANIIKHNITRVKVLAKHNVQNADKKFVFEDVLMSKTIQDQYSI